MKIAIVGGGASGVISAISLLRKHGARTEITIFDPAPSLGAGLAYGTDQPSHLLNVPAARMSCLADEPDDFLRWLEAGAPETFLSKHFPFVPRLYYRRYLQDRLKQAELAAGREVNWHRLKVESAEQVADGWKILCANDEAYSFHACWMATGYQHRNNPAVLRPDSGAEDFVFSAYEKPNFSFADKTADIAIAGMGLSAIDHWRQLREEGFTGTIHFISRRGNFPLSHPAYPSKVTLPVFRTHSPRQLFRQLREVQSSSDCGWPAVADALRPEVSKIWTRWTDLEKGQFVKHVKPYWEIIRHRMPATVLEELMLEKAVGKIQIHQARIRLISGGNGNIALEVEKKDRRIKFTVGLMINATGSQIERLPAIKGNSKYDLRIVGPAAKSIYWEITAVPEIVRQTAAFAAEI